MGGSKTGRTTADHGDPFTGGGVLGDIEFDFMTHAPIGDKTLQMIDGNRFIYKDTTAAGFTKTRTNPTHGEGQRVAFHDQTQGFFILPLGHMSYIPLDINLSGTGEITGRLAITKMGLGQDSQTFQAMSRYRGRICRNNHPVPGQGNTGAHQPFLSLYLDHAHLTVRLGRTSLHIT